MNNDMTFFYQVLKECFKCLPNDYNGFQIISACQFFQLEAMSVLLLTFPKDLFMMNRPLFLVGGRIYSNGPQ